MPGLTLRPPPRSPAGLPGPLRAADRTLVMGILNVTPDSFSDGGRFAGPAAAVAHGLRLLGEGADILDVGGESTRPGATRVPADEERARIIPVIRELAAAGAVISVDTMRAETARAAVAAGAAIVNDVSGGLADPQMLPAIAELSVPCVLMHWRGHSELMSGRAEYDDVVAQVADHLAGRLAAAAAAGIAAERVILDPGLGFAKDARHNWQLLHDLHRLAPPAVPLLVGASRKRFLGALLADPAGGPRPVDQRDAGSAAVGVLAAAAGAWCLRVHDVAAAADGVRVVAAWRSAGPEKEDV